MKVYAIIAFTCLAAFGCSSNIIITAPIDPSNGAQPLYLFNVEKSLIQTKKNRIYDLYAMVKIDEFKSNKKKSYELAIMKNSLVALELDDKKFIPFVYTDQIKPTLKLTTDTANHLLYLNNEPFCLYPDEASVNWMKNITDKTLKSIRAIILSGVQDYDVYVLKRLAGNQLTIMLQTNFPGTIPEKTAQALVDAAPVALVAFKNAGLDSIIGRLTSLTHLFMGTDKMPDVSLLTKLRFIGLSFADHDTSPRNLTVSLTPLAKHTSLTSLYIGSVSHIDIASLLSLTTVRHLSLQSISGLTDISCLSKMRHLRSLTLSGIDMKNVSPLSSLSNLKHLVLITNERKINGLSQLANLRKLKTLTLKKDYERYQPEEIKLIKKSLPQCDVIGFCMGSGWILLFSGLSLAIGLLWRRLMYR